ncbi:MAG: tRNA (uridine(34)/cytosine(34)/5-carboxymethylaminomethyluridine(34)-2'-O)-methyltransferase TrmL [Candidatus Cloacimonetes bacterium]|nr:tRNA (uridine(34)/cytosine(34)/5-carboxymethylaminomethyluridine(34)-2'-O)-methyltransferase TrmL [Candidatus Cloacimonadota bacterium]
MEKRNFDKQVSEPFRIVLFQPEIPANTGNISRLCVGSAAELHIIKPMRFLLTDKYMKRAGLDYWDNLKLILHDSYEEFLEKYKEERIYYLTTKAVKNYTDIEYKPGDFFMFGPETKGLPESIIFSEKNQENIVTIPMNKNIRSINLSNSVAIVLYEALRQNGFNNISDGK